MEDPAATSAEITSLAAALTDTTDGVALVYSVLDGLVDRHGLSDAFLVLRPGSLGTQLFRAGRSVPATEATPALLDRPVGLYTEPDVLDPTSRAALAGICNLAVTAHVARRKAATDDRSGLASREVIEGALSRAAASSARYGWPFTAVLLTTAGDGPADQRWLALCEALRAAGRIGDELGVAGPGSAWAILGNAGPDVVRPFVARVRAALSAGGAGGVDLLVATATAPAETVDPTELRRLAIERLAEAGGEARLDVGGGDEPGAEGDEPTDPSELELSLRELPGVVGVGRSGAADGSRLTVVALDPSDTLRASVARLAREPNRGSGTDVVVAGAAAPSASPPPSPAPVPATPGPAASNGTSAPPLLAATAPGSDTPTEGRRDRVGLLRAEFDPLRGLSEVSLTFHGARGTGRVPAGPLAGGAQATLVALGALGVELPFYLFSAERAHGIPGEPVVVVLAARHGTDRLQVGERIGVATGADEVEASSRATLGALNRYLAGTERDDAAHGTGGRTDATNPTNPTVGTNGANGRLEAGEKAHAG